MAEGKTYGISFPFVDSFDGKYLDLTDYAAEEIRTDLIHLILTRKGSRYFLPDFGTRLYEFVFDPLDGPTFQNIEAEIRDSVFLNILQRSELIMQFQMTFSIQKILLSSIFNINGTTENFIYG